MADKTKIEWTDATWNPIRARYWECQDDGSGKERVGWHCEHVSEGCRNCYAERINRRLGTGLEFKPGNLFREERRGYRNGEAKLFLDERMLMAPLRWRRPRMVFPCSMTDLFADFVPDGWIMAVFDIMWRTPWHSYQVLTKRSRRMRDFVMKWCDLRGEDLADFKGARGPDAVRKAHPSGRGQLFAAYLDALLERSGGKVPDGAAWPTFDWLGGMMWWPNVPPNVWLGVSAEDQARADERIPDLLATPAAVRFVSAEPLLGPVDLRKLWRTTSECWDALGGEIWRAGAGSIKSEMWQGGAKLDWVIVGGESGPNARPMHPDWARELRDQCAAAGVPFFMKQMSGPVKAKMPPIPADLMIREKPHASR